MDHLETDFVIIGGGLTGLALAYFLRNSGRSICILEARDRIGGRIHTIIEDGRTNMEMGATWLGNKHTVLVELLKELNIGLIEQEMGETAIYEAISTSPPQIVQLPPNNDPTFRIKGGSGKLIHGLQSELGENTQIFTGELVKSISFTEEKVNISSSGYQITCDKVISTLPPNLLANTIQFVPALPTTLTELMKTTHTWMGESIKIGLHYAHPFWTENNLSGTIVSNVGPIPEMYDHSNKEQKQYALKGFLNSTFYSLNKEERKTKVLQQLSKYYGEQVNDIILYEEKVWSLDPLTYTSYESHVLPHQHNGDATFRQSLFEDKLFIAGSETAELFPGYMEGAIRSASFVANKLLM